MKFDKNNYFEATQTTFKVLDNINADKEFVERSKWGVRLKAQYKLKYFVAKYFGIDKNDLEEMKKIEINYVSNFYGWGRKIGSIYFVYGQKIIRISDHWSFYVNGKNQKIQLNCGWIRSCLWNLSFKTKDAKKMKKNEFKEKWFVGITEFKKFKSIPTNELN